MPTEPKLSIILMLLAMGTMILGTYYLVGISLKSYFINVGEHFRAFVKQSVSFFKGML